MTIQELLHSSISKIKHLESSYLDLEVLLSYVLKKPREYILTNPKQEIYIEQEVQFNDLVKKRSLHIPIAYLINKKEFFGRNFYINKHVHIPRPATEDMINAIKQKIPIDFTGTMADIGTGSGIIAITLALEFPKAKIIAIDVSENALKVAQKNIIDHKLENRIELLQGSLYDPIKNHVDVVVANLPYGWSGDWTDDKETLHQLEIVYDGGVDGLELIKKLVNQLPKYLTNNGQVFLEFDPRQTKALKKFCIETNMNHTILKDSQNHNRILILKKI